LKKVNSRAVLAGSLLTSMLYVSTDADVHAVCLY
jgi:hypothetical protein